LDLHSVICEVFVEVSTESQVLVKFEKVSFDSVEMVFLVPLHILKFSQNCRKVQLNSKPISRKKNSIMTSLHINISHPKESMDRATTVTVSGKLNEGTLKFLLEHLVVLHQEDLHHSLLPSLVL
jgi:hypothetical protein